VPAGLDEEVAEQGRAVVAGRQVGHDDELVAPQDVRAVVLVLHADQAVVDHGGQHN
jgi:hypothetical protein